MTIRHWAIGVTIPLDPKIKREIGVQKVSNQSAGLCFQWHKSAGLSPGSYVLEDRATDKQPEPMYSLRLASIPET